MAGVIVAIFIAYVYKETKIYDSHTATKILKTRTNDNSYILTIMYCLSKTVKLKLILV